MKKKFLIAILLSAVCIISALFVSACNDEPYNSETDSSIDSETDSSIDSETDNSIDSETDNSINSETNSSIDNEILKHYHEPSINEDFEDNKVFVIFKSSYSDIKEIGFDDFKIVEKISEISSIKYNLKQINRGSEEKFILGKEKNHIFILELADHDKEKVLAAIKELQKLDMVLVAEPSYIYDIVDC